MTKWIPYRDLSINTVKVSNDLNKSVNGFYMMVVFWTTLFGARVFFCFKDELY